MFSKIKFVHTIHIYVYFIIKNLFKFVLFNFTDTLWYGIHTHTSDQIFSGLVNSKL